MRAISCGVSAGNVCSRRGKAAASRAWSSVLLAVLESTLIPSHIIKERAELCGARQGEGFLLGSRSPLFAPCYLPGFFPLTSCGVRSSPAEGAPVISLRPLACDFRRLRFSRNASFSRSRRGFFAAVPVG